MVPVAVLVRPPIDDVTVLNVNDALPATTACTVASIMQLLPAAISPPVKFSVPPLILGVPTQLDVAVPLGNTNDVGKPRLKLRFEAVFEPTLLILIDICTGWPTIALIGLKLIIAASVAGKVALPVKPLVTTAPALLVMDNWPLFAPLVIGLNATATAQLAPTATVNGGVVQVAPGAETRLNPALNVTLETVSSADPGLSICTSWKALVAPTSVLGKLSVPSGVTFIPG